MITQRLFVILSVTMLMQAGLGSAPRSCPTPKGDLKLFSNPEDGYCLLYPVEFETNTAPFILVLNPLSGAGDVLGDASVSIDVESANSRTAAQAADGEFQPLDGQDFNLTRTEITVDGKQAIVVDGLPGPDPWRKVFIVQGERLYTLTFFPWIPAGGSTPLEALYDSMMETIHFTAPAKPLPTPTIGWSHANEPPALAFEYPFNGQVFDYEGDYYFKVAEIQGADGSLWSFSQSGIVVWENLRDEMGLTAGGTYAILQGSEAHRRFVSGPLQVSVSPQQGSYRGQSTVIMVILRSP